METFNTTCSYVTQNKLGDCGSTRHLHKETHTRKPFLQVLASYIQIPKKKARDVDAESKLVQFYISEWSECTAPHRTHGILRRKTTKKRFFFGSAFESAALFQRRSCPCYYLQSWSIRPIFAGRCRRCVVWIAS